jgi:hypothetical protein
MPTAAPKEIVRVGSRDVVITNPQKVLFPEAGHTKLDLVRYYLLVADGALRGSGGRPNIMVRFPDGIGSEFFFQKRAPTERPAASAPTGVGAGPVSIEPSGDTAAPKASKTHVAGQAGPHQAVPAVDKEGDADADHDGSRGMAGSGGSGDDDDADRGGSHVDASDDGVHELGHDGSVDSDGGDSGG